MTETNGYESANGEIVAAWTRTHQTDEETHVFVVDLGSIFLAIAVDVDGQGNLIASELIDDALTAAEARERAEQWLGQNEKGIKGDGGIAGLLDFGS